MRRELFDSQKGQPMDVKKLAIGGAIVFAAYLAYKKFA